MFVILARGFALVGAPLSFRSISDICGCGRICKDSPRNACRHKCPAEAYVLAVSSEKLTTSFSSRGATNHVSATVPPCVRSSSHMSPPSVHYTSFAQATVALFSLVQIFALPPARPRAASWRKLAREASFVFVILARHFALVEAPLSFRSISDICGCGLICKDSLRNVCRHKCPAEAHVLAVSSEEL